MSDRPIIMMLKSKLETIYMFRFHVNIFLSFYNRKNLFMKEKLNKKETYKLFNR